MFSKQDYIDNVDNIRDKIKTNMDLIQYLTSELKKYDCHICEYMIPDTMMIYLNNNIRIKIQGDADELPPLPNNIVSIGSRVGKNVFVLYICPVERLDCVGFDFLQNKLYNGSKVGVRNLDNTMLGLGEVSDIKYMRWNASDPRVTVLTQTGELKTDEFRCEQLFLIDDVTYMDYCLTKG